MSLARALITQRFETIAPESISQHPSEPLISALGGRPTSSGQRVNERTATGIPVVYACDKILKESVAQAPIKLMRRNADGTREPDRNHPVYGIFHDRPNPVMSAAEFKEAAQSHLNLWGNHYSEIERDTRNRVKALWPLDPSRMEVTLDGLNRLVYTYRLASGKPKDYIFDPANPPIFHIRQNALDGIHGRGPVTVLRESLGIAQAAERYQGKVFGQGGHAQIALSTPKGLTEAAARRIRTDYEAMTAGEDNWHRVVVLDHDLKPLPITMPHRDAQFLETRKFSRSELGGAFRVPAHMYNDLEKATFSNIEHQQIAFVQYSLMPQFVRWQQAIARDLLNPKSFQTHFAVFVVDALVRGDIKTQNIALQLQRQNGVITANQWRKMLDYDDLIPADDGGDLYLVNGNMMPMHRDPAGVLSGAGAMN